MIYAEDPPSKGNLPVTKRYKIIPKAQISTY